jgi:hypothetical protein
MLKVDKIILFNLIWLILFPYITLFTKIAYIVNFNYFSSGGSLIPVIIIHFSFIVVPIFGLISYLRGFRLLHSKQDIKRRWQYLGLGIADSILLVLMVISLPGLLYM